MADYKDFYLTDPKPVPVEQLKQLLRIVWDGDLVSKADRDELVNRGYVIRTNGGYNIATKEGIEYLHSNGYLHP